MLSVPILDAEDPYWVFLCSQVTMRLFDHYGEGNQAVSVILSHHPYLNKETQQNDASVEDGALVLEVQLEQNAPALPAGHHSVWRKQ